MTGDAAIDGDDDNWGDSLAVARPLWYAVTHDPHALSLAAGAVTPQTARVLRAAARAAAAAVIPLGPHSPDSAADPSGRGRRVETPRRRTDASTAAVEVVRAVRRALAIELRHGHAAYLQSTYVRPTFLRERRSDREQREREREREALWLLTQEHRIERNPNYNIDSDNNDVAARVSGAGVGGAVGLGVSASGGNDSYIDIDLDMSSNVVSKSRVGGRDNLSVDVSVGGSSGRRPSRFARILQRRLGVDPRLVDHNRGDVVTL